VIEIQVVDGVRPGPKLVYDQPTVRVGRHGSNDVVLPRPHVSGRHGEFHLAAGTVVYRDVETTNGTFVRRSDALIPVDASRAFEIVVADGDELYLGDPELSTYLRIGLSASNDADLSPDVLDASNVEVLTHVDMADEAGLRRLSSSFDREALLVLHEHAARATRLRELPDILNSFATAALELYSNANHVSVFLGDTNSGEPEPALVRARDGQAQGRKLSRTLLDLIRERRQAVTFSIADPNFDNAASLRNPTVRAGMCAPLWSGERLVGLVQIDWRGELQVPFGQHDLGALAVLANELAVSVEKSRLQTELEQTIAELRQTQAQMETLAFRDSLTGLSNRRLLSDRVEQAVKMTRREHRKFALLYLDLDGFKRVNDTFGHEAGDLLLKTVANRLRACLRAQDTVARIGGDEFAALLFDVADEAATRIVARKMLDLLRQPIHLPKQQVTVTASMGITILPDDGTGVSELLRKADRAMYRAKSRGRDKFQFFTEEMNSVASRQLFLETELRQALSADQFIEHFQPVVSLDSSTVVGMEALVRWQHPQRGLTMPEQLIKVAEETGLIVPLGNWVLHTACQAARTLDGSDLGAIRMAVNLSARQFVESELPAFVESVLDRTGLAPNRLVIEITESILLEDTREALGRLRRLKDLGVSLCVDDFGTGYSSLSYLKRFPVDLLKIDRSFVRGIPHDSSDIEIAAAVIAMAHKLKIEVVAEGVETPAQLKFLRSNDCDYAQGFLFGEPRDIVDTLTLHRTAVPSC
jgi:diguanylate cyclase (GGDEF)-like protein